MMNDFDHNFDNYFSTIRNKELQNGYLAEDLAAFK